MKSAEEVVALYRSRQKASDPNREIMREMLNLYQGDIAVPLPEMRRDEKPAVVNLAKQGINQMGMRCASVMPTMAFPPIPTGRQEDAEKNALKRRKVAMSWWDEIGQNIKLRQRGRWLFAYAHAPSFVCPDFKEGRPSYKPVSPLDVYGAHVGSFDDMVPHDAIVSAIHSVGWCKMQWEQTSMVLRDMKDDALCEVLHFVDSEEYHTVVTPRLSVQEVQVAQWTTNKALRAVTVERHANLTGRPWVVIPRAISLERPIGLYDGIVGMYEAQAELEALSRIARRKGVFWEEWLVTENNGAPEILVRANPYTGTVGVVRGGKLERLSPEVQYATDTGVDRMERNMRVEAGLPADFGGEAGSNIRTGARANTLIQSAVDPVLQEAHELFARSLEYENQIAIAIDKSYWSGRKKTVYLSSGESLEYDPGKVWETDRHRVDYSMAGSDINQMTIVPAQMVGAGLMSPETAMSYHPLIKDVERERDRIAVGRLENAVFLGLEQLIATPGGVPIGDVVRMISIIKSGEADITGAYQKVQEEAQARQANAAQSPEAAMPGMEMPGQGAEAGAGGSIPAPSQDQNDLQRILGAVRMQAMSTPQERGVA